MKITHVSIDWMDSWANHPQWIVELDHGATPPVYSDSQKLQYTERGGIYRADHGAYVSFFYWSGEPGSGFDGRHFELLMADGSVVTLKGPWSSRAGAVNDVFPEDMVVDVSMRERDGGLLAGAVRMQDMIDYCQRCSIPCALTKARYNEKELILQPLRKGQLKDPGEVIVARYE